MKIAMIGQKGIPSRAGGIEIHVEEISRHLVRLGCEVDVYCRKGYCNSDANYYDGIRIIYTPYIRTKHLDAITHTFFSTIKALFSKTDIFHYHAFGPSILAFIPRIFGKKVVCTVHGLDWQRGKWGGIASRILKFGEYSVAKFPHAVINVSKNLVEYFKKKYNRETVYIPNGVTEKEIVEPKIIKEKYNLEKNGYILFLSRLVPEKGAHYLIEAFKKLETDKFLVIAGGESHSGAYVSKLHEMAQNDKRIIFTGFVQGDELAELYSNAYIYVLPSDIEGLPISLLEAMSYGNCCLTSDIPENTNVTEKYGYKFKKGDPQDLLLTLKKMLSEKDKIEDIKHKERNFVLNIYKWEEIANNTFLVYNKIMCAR